MNIRFFGLLYLEPNEKSSVNLRTKNFQDQIIIYLKNAINLTSTLQKRGIDFTLLTNQKEKLVELSLSIKPNLNPKIKEIVFNTFVPNGIRFYSAHYKMDVFKYLASLNEPYVGLIDLDMIAINNIPDSLPCIINEKIPLYYDISDQVIPEYGFLRIANDMKKLSPNTREGKWAGGEFLAGPPSFFLELSDVLVPIYDNYLLAYNEVFHQGDELPTSVALEILRRKGKMIIDAGLLGIIGRYWSVRTRFPQKPFSFYKKCFLLHLPADKKFLASYSEGGLISKFDFLSEYFVYQAIRHILSYYKFAILNVFSKHRPINQIEH